jgi:enterochelin esterase-like enzyme
VALVLGCLALIQGRIEPVACGPRRMLVYLPPDYPQHAPYPVLYLLHGAGDDETAWLRHGAADTILTRLQVRGDAVPMIAVMPDAQGRGSFFRDDLVEEVIPYIDAHYPTRPDRHSRALAGVSLGGGQALKIGLSHPDRFAWIGAFSPSLPGPMEEDVNGRLANPAVWRGPRDLLWLATGDADQLRGLNEALHRTLEEKQVPHQWRVYPGEHAWSPWRRSLGEFAARLFR